MGFRINLSESRKCVLYVCQPSPLKLVMEPRALGLLGKYAITELLLNPVCGFFFFFKGSRKFKKIIVFEFFSICKNFSINYTLISIYFKQLYNNPPCISLINYWVE